MLTLISSELVAAGNTMAIPHTGDVTIRVEWVDGRVTESTHRYLSSAYDVISGDCHPFKRWEVLGTVAGFGPNKGAK